jgi:hypothetical protein
VPAFSRRGRALGFKALQFNFVVSTNTVAVELWQKCGFVIAAGCRRLSRIRKGIGGCICHVSVAELRRRRDEKIPGAKPLALTAPVWVIGSYGEDGAPCLMTAAWCGVCCSEPACVAVAVRKSRLSHANIAARKAFTVNIPGR